jgi:hypothetical protein
VDREWEGKRGEVPRARRVVESSSGDEERMDRILELAGQVRSDGE